NGHYKIVGKQSGKCIDVAGANPASGTKVQLWTCNGSSAQLWNPALAGGGSGGGPGSPGGSGGSGGSSGGGGPVGNFPARFSAPYVPTWDNTNLANLASSTGNKFWTLAFVLSNGSCTPTWNGDTSLAGNSYGGYISALRKLGGDVIVSFGGQ